MKLILVSAKCAQFLQTHQPPCTFQYCRMSTISKARISIVNPPPRPFARVWRRFINLFRKPPFLVLLIFADPEVCSATLGVRCGWQSDSSVRLFVQVRDAGCQTDETGPTSMTAEVYGYFVYSGSAWEIHPVTGVPLWFVG